VETGVRPGDEIEAVLWSDVDLEKRLAHVRGTKTDGSDRHLPIRDSFAEHLAAARGDAGDDEPIAGRWSNARRDIAKACEKAGIRRIRPYDLRHAYASWALQGGAPEADVAKALGHSTTTMVHRVYGHLRPEHLRTVIDALPETPCSGPAEADGSDGNGAGFAHHLPQDVSETGANGAKTGEEQVADQTRNLPESLEIGVPRGGFEPPTRGFSVRCSTN